MDDAFLQAILAAPELLQSLAMNVLRLAGKR